MDTRVTEEAIGAIRPQRRLLRRRATHAPGHRRRLAFVTIWLTPIMALFLIFSFLPVGMVLWLSVHQTNTGELTAPFNGLHYYDYAFHVDPFFSQALTNTIKYVAISVPVNLVVSFPIALGLSRIERLRALFRTSFFIPVVASAVAVSLVWLPIYDPQSGWLNALMGRIGLPTEAWLQDPSTALWSVMAAAVWQDLGYNIIIFLAGLQSIPTDFYDAARVDGAGPWSRLCRITLPLMQRTIAFVLVLTVISYMQEFTHIQVMTNGGPINSSNVLVLYIYQTAFGSNPLLGYASAMAVVLLGIILVITLAQLYLLRQRWEY
jgi:ABC-type sugar transport system permease subunit